ncbi:hypothetical protein B296_00005442 [Ensete ventricosum]|uniref:Tify domain-containing protein n=1 Tax=Ensete ventricosum TaxID=4639 RepID=A0A427A895_ENSVE|nr:hypothetical protein B296_00005442 [Ensete ventricosum]
MPAMPNAVTPTQVTIFYDGDLFSENSVVMRQTQAIMLIAAAAATTPAKGPSMFGRTDDTASAAAATVLTRSLSLPNPLCKLPVGWFSFSLALDFL